MMRYASWISELKESFLGEILKTASYEDVISFAGGLPAQELFPKDELKECFDQVFEEDGFIALQYAEALGYDPLRAWILEQIDGGKKVKTMEDIIITTGGQQGLSLVAQTFIDPADVILVESPTYLGALQAFQSCKPRVLTVPSDQDGIIPEDLEDILKKHNPKFLYVIPNYQNPTGRIMSLQRRKDLVETAAKFNLLIVEDNPYGQLRYEGEAYPNLMDMYDNVIYLGSFSKILSPGLRVGYVIAKKDIINQIARAKEGMDLFSNSLAQRAVFKYVTCKSINEHITKLRKAYTARRDVMLSSFEKYIGDWAKINRPKGGLFVWVKIEKIKDSKEFLEQWAQKEKVIFVPGTFFYVDGRISNEMRINFSCSSPEVIEEGVKRIAQALSKVK